MTIRVMSWNIAGAKLLGNLDPKTPNSKAADTYTNAYREVWRDGIFPYLQHGAGESVYPDIILLQECIGFEDKRLEGRSGRWPKGKEILGSIFGGYTCFFFPSLSSHPHPHPRKWLPFSREEAEKNNKPFLPEYVEAQQGYGICVQEGADLRKIWIPVLHPDKEKDLHRDKPGGDGEHHLCVECTETTMGKQYQGDRDSEPRLVVMGRCFRGSSDGRGRYINFLNLHLDTMRGERAGNIRLDRQGNVARMRQIEGILDGVISAYQEASEYRVPRGRWDTAGEDLWILGGDFNATPDSGVIATVKRSGFVDGNTDKKIIDADTNSPLHNQEGTKWSIDQKRRTLPPVIVDYIFCGIERTSFRTNEVNVENSVRPYRPRFQDPRFESDHAVLFACFKLPD